ncbi:MAG: SUMF1/EgtB/PvdO family nonheme iron enzyme [bacterium]|nr:SUMF1/EgtB/PvdO family nonheme iron enzyme [bacterium]
MGIRYFDEGSIPEVPFAVDDAIDLAYLFAHELRLITPQNIVLALAGEPQKPDSLKRLKALLTAGAKRKPPRFPEIFRHLDEQRKAAGRRGLLVVAVATHGVNTQAGDFLVATNSLEQLIPDTSIRVHRIFDRVRRAKAQRRVVLLDACRERLLGGRARGTDPASAMSQSFVDAIANASGQAVLAGATPGGYAYDDHQRRNGVFTAAVIDGLHGEAAADERGLITIMTLAAYVNARVLAWVQENRPQDAEFSRGITIQLDGLAATMPLAADPSAVEEVRAYRRRRDAALELLRRNIGGPGDPISGSLSDEIARVLTVDFPSPNRLKLVEELEMLDGSLQMQRSVAYYFSQHGSELMAELEEASQPNELAIKTPQPSSRPDWKDPILGIRFSPIPAGSFAMGSPRTEAGREADERQHVVKLTRGFWIGTTEVTQSQFAQFVEETGFQTDAEKRGWSWSWDGRKWDKKKGATWRESGGKNHPVVHVSWKDAQEFCRWLSERTGERIRLPTEAEWEYATRAGMESATYAGDLTIQGSCDASQLEEIAWYCGNSSWKVHPVGRKSANGWGMHDTLGNVWEWVHDASYSVAGEVVTDTYRKDTTDPLSTRGTNRIIRGGGWYGFSGDCRAANRNASNPDRSTDFVGFRIVRTANDSSPTFLYPAGDIKAEFLSSFRSLLVRNQSNRLLILGGTPPDGSPQQ